MHFRLDTQKASPIFSHYMTCLIVTVCVCEAGGGRHLRDRRVGVVETNRG